MQRNNFANSPKEIAASLALRTEDVIKYLGLDGKEISGGKTFETGSVDGEKGQSLKITLKTVGRYRRGNWIDFSSGDRGDLLELWMLNKGHANVGQTMKDACDFLNIPVFKDQAKKRGYNPPAVVIDNTSTEPYKPKKKLLEDASEQNISRLHASLLKNKEALTYLDKRGIGLDTVRKFQLGLSGSYTNKDGITRDQFLTYPLLDCDGKFKKKYGYIGIPNVSIASDNEMLSFMAGGTVAYYNKFLSFEVSILLILEGHKDLWALDQFLRGTPYETQILLMTSCNGVNSIPPELYDENFICKFRKVFCLYDNDKASNNAAERLKDVIVSKPLYRVKVSNDLVPEGNTNSRGKPKPDGADITDFILNGATISDFEDLMRSAVDMSTHHQIPASQTLKLEDMNIGSNVYKPFNPNISFHGGHLYYPINVHITGIDDETGERYEMLSVKVLRSDRKILHMLPSKLPKNAEKGSAVLRLSDHSVVSEAPRPNPYASWDFDYARKWLNNEYEIPEALSLFERTVAHLKGCVHLPEKHDYTLLALVVMATYVQNIFEAIPYILLNGVKGSGKSELGEALNKVGANANAMTGVSAATLSREMDRTAGLLIIDDLEGVGNKTRQEGAFSELCQYLKVGYKRSSAIRKVTDPVTLKPIELNMFGIKVIGNTGGVLDDTLLNRMFVIKTKRLPEGASWEKVYLPSDEVFKLRQDLHAWSFENVGEIYSIYQSKYARTTNREDEIAAPLHVIAEHIRSPMVTSSLASAIKVQDVRRMAADGPENYLEEACKQLVRQGYQESLVTHIQYEMKTLIDPLEGRDSKYEIVDWDRLAWITNTLSDLDIITETRGRKNLNGQKLRSLVFKDDFVKSVREDNSGLAAIKDDPRDFCLKQTCMQCPYVDICDMTKRHSLNEKEIRGSR